MPWGVSLGSHPVDLPSHGFGTKRVVAKIFGWGWGWGRPGCGFRGGGVGHPVGRIWGARPPPIEPCDVLVPFATKQANTQHRGLAEPRAGLVVGALEPEQLATRAVRGPAGPGPQPVRSGRFSLRTQTHTHTHTERPLAACDEPRTQKHTRTHRFGLEGLALAAPQEMGRL
jgi:hypothetical protein